MNKPRNEQIYKAMDLFEKFEQSLELKPLLIKDRLELFFMLEQNAIFDVCQGCDYDETRRALESFISSKEVVM